MRWEEWRNFRSLETAKGPRLQLDWSQKEDISLCFSQWIESTDWAAEVVNGDKGRRPHATNWKCASQSRCKKERILLGHSEKLAMAFGLIDSTKGRWYGLPRTYGCVKTGTLWRNSFPCIQGGRSSFRIWIIFTISKMGCAPTGIIGRLLAQFIWLTLERHWNSIMFEL